MKKLSFKSLIMLLAVVVLFNGASFAYLDKLDKAVVVLFNGASFAQGVVNAIQDVFDSFPPVRVDG
jgi:cell shape-determining protein MreC